MNLFMRGNCPKKKKEREEKRNIKPCVSFLSKKNIILVLTGTEDITKC